MQTIDVPFPLPVQFIDDLVLGMSREMGESVPATDELKIDLFQRWVKQRARETITNVRLQRASSLVGLDDSDGLLSW